MSSRVRPEHRTERYLPADSGDVSEAPSALSLPTPTDLRDYGVIGNLHTAALVSRFGSVDWACLPRFASPSVFARLLDARRGGYHAIAPVEEARSEQEYIPSTAILETRFSLPGRRRLDVTDFMPVGSVTGGEGLPMIVRLAEAHGGPIPIHTTFQPRFNYGADRPEWREGIDGWVAECDETRVLYRSPGRFGPSGDRIDVDHVLEPGVVLAVEIISGGRRRVRESASRLLRDTERFWRGWVHTPGTPLHAIAGEWHPWIERSEITLKVLSHADTGTFVAAPTTSLPEWPGGVRNWDYRFVWIRDAAFTAQALLLLGHAREARAFLTWVVSRWTSTKEGTLRVVYPTHPREDVTERELRGLAGFLDSRPVRVGNGASDQFQLDIYGELLDAAALLADRQEDAVRSIWPQLAGVAAEVERTWRQPDSGIWEFRTPPDHYTHSKLMAWVALDRAARIARRFGELKEAEQWRRGADRVRRAILARGVAPDGGGFVQAFGGTAIDAANLRIPLVGFLPYDDPRVVATVDRVEHELTHGPFVYRYANDDGIPGPEGAFLPCGFWLVEVHARLGRRSQAADRFRGLLKAGSPLRLFSEEFDPKGRRMLGNYPQAFTHIALLRAALALGLSTAPGVIREELAWLPEYLMRTD